MSNTVNRLIVVLATCVFSTWNCAGDAGEVDLILYNGKIITVDPDDTIAEAVAIGGERLLAVGNNDEILALATSGTERVDLQGHAATPGLIDAHAHFGMGGANMLYVLDLSYPNVKHMADVVGLVRKQIDGLASGAWVQGRGWDEGKLKERRYIYAADLDSISPNNPVWLTHTMGHYGVANTVALKLAGITPDTPDPPNGTIDRFPDGTPTGVLKESAQHLVRRIMPRRTPEQVRAGMRALADAFNRAGMTGVKDPGIGPRMWEMYRDVLASGDLSVRVFCSGARQDLSRSGNHVGRRVGLQRHPVRREQGTMGVGGAQDTARQMFMEDKIGSIEVGKYADIAVWDRDLYAVPADSLENLTALVTVFNGKVVYRSVGAPGDWPRGR